MVAELSGGQSARVALIGHFRHFNQIFRAGIALSGNAKGYEMDCRGSIPSRGKGYLLHSVQTGSEVHQASYPMGTEDTFFWDIAVGA
jgi:hypothetical protein